jgi:uncharacterized protein YhbP (UPF0306 family)
VFAVKYELGFISQNMAFFIVTAAKTSHLTNISVNSEMCFGT